jgi:hypothetical protein
MRPTHRPNLPLIILVYGMVASAGHAAAQQATNATAAAVAEFNKQVKAYMALHVKEEGSLQDVKKGATPAEVQAFEKALAGRIKTARATAKQGDVFVADVVPVFRKIFADYYQRRSGREKRLLFDEVPNFKPEVNMTYPVNAPKATFPPRLSLALPDLTDELEYRLVATSLILRDSEANLIVDYIPNVLPPSTKPANPAGPANP